MRVFIGQLITESNTFAPFPTARSDYEELGIYHGNATEVDPDGVFAVLTRWRRELEANGHEVIEGLAAQAKPGGRTLRTVYEAFRNDILEQVRANLPLDAILLNLHGAMAADGYDDCEGDLLERLREIVGAHTAIGIELDLHCHLSAHMVRAADIIVSYKHYPHTDILDRAAQVAALTLAAAQKRIVPVISVVDCHMVGLWHTTREPMASFVRKMGELEDGRSVLSVSFGHGFPWGDVADAGAKIWVVTNADREKGDRLALTLAAELFAIREEIGQPLLSIEAALDQVERSTRFPIVAADGADNAGGGAPSDSTFILKRVLERGVENVLVAFLYDPQAGAIMAKAGVGAVLLMRVGGKTGPTSGDPVDLRLEVKAIIEEHHQSGIGFRWPVGRAVWARGPAGLDLIFSSIRTQPFDPASIESLGVDLSAKRLIVVKSIQHFYTGFAPIARGGVIYIAAPGALTPDFRSIPYLTRSIDYWPRRDDVRPELVARVT